MTASLEHVKAFLPEQVVPGRRLGRSVVLHDPKSREYPVRPLLAQMQAVKQPWWRRGVFDQDGQSSCTSEGTCGILVTAPFRDDPHVRAQRVRLLDPQFRYLLYRRAQREFDPWQGEEPTYFGTATLAILKAAKAEGLVPEGWQYRWCFSWEDVRDTLRARAPVVAGTVWVEGFDHPRPWDGLVKLEGEDRGGHLWEAVYYDEGDDEVVGINSWGVGYGKRGRFRMKRATFIELMERQGEVATWVPG